MRDPNTFNADFTVMTLKNIKHATVDGKKKDKKALNIILSAQKKHETKHKLSLEEIEIYLQHI